MSTTSDDQNGHRDGDALGGAPHEDGLGAAATTGDVAQGGAVPAADASTPVTPASPAEPVEEPLVETPSETVAAPVSDPGVTWAEPASTDPVAEPVVAAPFAADPVADAVVEPTSPVEPAAEPAAAAPVFGEPVAAEPTVAPVAEPASQEAYQPEPLVEPEPLIEPEPTPAPAVDPTLAYTDPAAHHGDVAAPAEPVEQAAEGAAAAEPAPVAAQPTTAQPVASDPAAVAAAAPAAASPVYVAAPVPPKKRGNRGLGTLLAILGALAFALVHPMVTAVVYAIDDRTIDFAAFFTSAAFIVPVATFAVVFILAVMIINRAGWWAWVLGSLVIAAVTYYASAGVILLLENVVAMTPSQAASTWQGITVSVPLIVALVVAREISVWFGLAIAARGRRVKARNAEALAVHERELAENRARYGTLQ